MSSRDRLFWTEFLQLYRALPAVWKLKSPEYSSRKQKTAAYEKLVKKLLEVEPKANRSMVIQKINTFRTNYRRDLRKREQCPDGERFESTLWYYDLLGFLDDVSSPPCQSMGSGAIKRSPSESYTEAEEFLDDDSLECYQPAFESTPPQTKRRKSTAAEASAATLRSVNLRADCPKSPASSSSALQQHEQRLELKARAVYKLQSERQRALADSESLAHSWSTQYNELTALQKVLARKLISDVLYYGCMQQLSPSHVPQLQHIISQRSSSPLIEDVSASPNDVRVVYNLDSDLDGD